MLSFSFKWTKIATVGWVFVLFLSVHASAQTKAGARAKTGAAKSAVVPGPKITRVDDAGFRKLLVPNGKPLMINFWATWCGPCRKEFPDLVMLDGEYRGKIDFITVTLDFEEELNTGVPKFLADMKAQMPTFLLVTPDETAAIAAVTKEWAGALPFTVIYEPNGSLAYFHQGIIKPEDVRAELNKLLPAAESAKPTL
ncbi:MAG: TlpA family protein disulfide reductase [Pyrinomonadaceae bacterium]